MGEYFRKTLGCKQLVNASNWRTADQLKLDDVERWTYAALDVIAVNRYTGGVHEGANNGYRIDPGHRILSRSILKDPLQLPVNLKQVADAIEMHESTISRVTTNKYVHTPQGIFELKFFFNSGISRNYGEDIASESVKNEIKQIVQGEPAEHPFSDQKIVELLTAKNINIARRTVAKYREILGILPSSKRKRMF